MGAHMKQLYNRIETLVSTGDLFVQNFEQTNLPDSNKAVARLNHLKDKDINWRRLKAYCINNGLEIKEVDDEKFGTVKSYPIEAFKMIYPELITE